uniref:Mediator of RNA polymerase II transcription subunit 15 n=1 Tax=Lepisosteus oculatus TaxID=7918 RepID=W5MHH6_LEPOC
MEVPGPDSDWRSLAFRQKVVGQIEDAMRKAGTAHAKTSNDMENHVFMKAKSRDEYLSLVARLIIHFRDILWRDSGERLWTSSFLADPMNALQNLTGGNQGGAASMGLGAHPQGMAALGQMLPGQPQPGSSGMTPHGIQEVDLTWGGTVQGHVHKAYDSYVQGTISKQSGFQTMQLKPKYSRKRRRVQSNSSNLPTFESLFNVTCLQVPRRPQQWLSLHMWLPCHSPSVLLQAQPRSINLSLQMLQSRMQQQPQQIAQLQLQQQQVVRAWSLPFLYLHPTYTDAMSILPPSASLKPTPTAGPNQMPSQSQPQAVVPQGQIQAQQVPLSSLNQQHHLKLQAMQQALALAHSWAGNSSCNQSYYMSVVPLSSKMMSATMVRGGIQPRLPRVSPASTLPPNSSGLGGQQMPQGGMTMMSSPSPVQQVQTPQSMPPPPQPQPSPQPPSSQPNSVRSSSGPAPSPGGFLPSPSPQPSQSPVTARTPQNFGVPSPGPLNTPEGNPNSVMSPASSSQTEEQQYLEKLKQLSKYIEPLRRMINKIDKNEDRKKDLSKMKSLLDILTDPSKRCPLKTLQKCEIALEKLKNDMAVPTPPPPPVPSTKQQYLCQPLLDVVMANIRSPVFNHSLYRTFAPAMTAIHGPPIMGPMIATRKRKYEDDEKQTIPNILQGEVARLNSKFLVNLDPSHCSNNGTVHLICKLDDKHLPSVPPLQLSIPADYPEQSPQWADDAQQYDANPFLQTVHRNMTSKLLQLPDKHSVTALLNTWAQSVKQACLSAA